MTAGALTTVCTDAAEEDDLLETELVSELAISSSALAVNAFFLFSRSLRDGRLGLVSFAFIPGTGAAEPPARTSASLLRARRHLSRCFSTTVV